MSHKVKISGIYKIESISHPERIYIGSAINIKKRWNYHTEGLSHNKHHSQKLQRHFNKYGRNDLMFSVVEECPSVLLIQREQFYINALKPYFNIAKIAGSCLGVKRSKETMLKQLATRKANNKSLSEEGHKNISKALLGNTNGRGSRGKKRKPRTEEAKRKQSERMMGHRRCVGRVYSEQTIEKFREDWDKRKQTTSSKYRGVVISGGRITCAIYIKSKRIYLGNFKSEEDAARAYDKAAKELLGIKAHLNFPEEI